MRALASLILVSAAAGLAANPSAAQMPAHAAQVQPFAAAVANPELIFEPITTCRAFDTHTTSALASPRPFAISGGANLKSQGGAKGGCGIPLSASAVTISLTTTDANESGSIAAYPSGKPATSAPVVSYSPGIQMTAGTTASINNHQLTLAPSAGSVQVAGDVTGYFAPQIEALINPDGSIYYSTSRVLSVSHVATGTYAIMVDRDVIGCSAITVSGDAAYTATSMESTGGAVDVYTSSVSSRNVADSYFYLTVNC